MSEFRMTELHALLNFAGQSRSGNKEVLQVLRGVYIFDSGLGLVFLYNPKLFLYMEDCRGSPPRRENF